jgi:hypothetical protein
MITGARRVFAAASALWFAILMVAGPAVHECAMHDARAAAVATVDHGHANHGATAPAPDDAACEHCSCVGDCVGAVFTAVTGPAAPLSSIVLARTVAPPVRALPPAAGSPQLRLPFAVGPPLLA